MLPWCPTKHHFVTEMCTCVHISVTKRCIVGYVTGALWDLCDRSNPRERGISATYCFLYHWRISFLTLMTLFEAKFPRDIPFAIYQSNLATFPCLRNKKYSRAQYNTRDSTGCQWMSQLEIMPNIVHKGLDRLLCSYNGWTCVRWTHFATLC